MGNHNSTRWKDYTKRRTVEECRRISAREARHLNIVTVTTFMPGGAQRLWCICPACKVRVWFLYQLADGGKWQCRTCHTLVYKSAQQRGTRAAFNAWLTPERWENISQKHPATMRLYERMAELWQENVEPYNWEKVSPERRAELLQSYTSPDTVHRVFEHQRWKWSGDIGLLEQAAGEEILTELWKCWKHDNRTKGP